MFTRHCQCCTLTCTYRHKNTQYRRKQNTYPSPPPIHFGSSADILTAKYANAPAPPGSVRVAKYVLPALSVGSAPAPSSAPSTRSSNQWGS